MQVDGSVNVMAAEEGVEQEPAPTEVGPTPSHWVTRQATAMDRKKWNRALKRKIDKGIVSEEVAQPQFRRGRRDCSSAMQASKKPEGKRQYKEPE